MDNVNSQALSRFIEGLRNDVDNHSKTENSYNNGVNGRLYSQNGIISFSSIKGTVKVYENENIINILGHWAFDDELILIVKYKKSSDGGSGGSGGTETETINKLIAYNKNVSSLNNNVEFNLSSSIELASYEIEIDDNGNIDYGYNRPFSCTDSNGDEINFSEYYEEIITNSNIQVCNLISNNEFENNKDYLDAFISITRNENGNLEGKLIWKGYLNIPVDAKICCYGLHENAFYKRVYFTDYVNPFRVINIRDTNINSRNFKEFQTFQSDALLSPIIERIEEGGQLAAGSILYSFRLITENGQITEFSPFSDSVKILKNTDNGIDYKGGDISERTNKMVIVKCNIPNWKNFKEVECIAIEYEALGAPTAIRSLGVKQTAAFVLFNHYGNESEFGNNITLSQILTRQNNWKYCSDLTAKKNKLITSGLRNDPISNVLLNLQKDFALHSWDEFGETHHCLVNPKPWKYRYIDPSNSNDMYYVKEKMYEYIKVFGNFKIKLLNSTTGEFIENQFVSENKINYVDFTERIFIWLSEIKNDVTFPTKFPNLKFEFIANRIFFKPISSLTETNISDYIFEYSHSQVIEEFQEDIKFRNLNVNASNLVYGAQSLGFNKGNGIRITYQSILTPLLNKSNGPYSGGNLLDLLIPDEKKGFFKGEIYRLGFQIFDTEGSQLFNIPIGDIKIPEIGEQKKYIDDFGNVIIETEFYSNSKVIDNVLYGEKIILKAEVRLSCEIQKMVSMYQLTYVERTEKNRTILCQGISAPMERVNVFHHSEHITLKDPVANKWNLPFFGGPTYDHYGLKRYDEDPNKNDEWSNYWRVITNRSLIYFDSPEIIFNRISSDLIANGNIQRIGRLNPDNSKLSWRKINQPETFPSFSRKIRNSNIAGDENKKSYFVNNSVFLERLGLKNLIKIDKSEELKRGEIIPGSSLNVSHDVSNNAMTLAKQSWFYSFRARESDACRTENGAKYELFDSNNFSPGYPTVIIKASENVFTDEFIDEALTYINGSGEMASSTYSDGYYFSTHALINIKMNNEESIYGGRSEIAYSKNIFIPLSKTIPVLKTSNNIQSFDVYGDSYTTLYSRNKNNYNTSQVYEKDMNNYPNCSRNKFEEEDYDRNGAWIYNVVLECSFEPKWTHEDVVYRQKGSIDFNQVYNESINEAYYQENTLRSYISKPYNFKDDPNMNNIVAVSETKMSGDYIDNWTSFKVNNFYELEKDKGAAYNLAKYLDQIYVIQEHQTSQVSLDENVMMPSSNGEVSIQQGSGQGISNHTILSDYGTSIRRAIVEQSQNTKERGGFSFIDERKFEWLKIDKPLFFDKNLHLKFKEIFKEDKIIDTEGYYDDEFKETNIRIRTKSGNNFTMSFNEALQVFNGYIEYDNDLYIAWDEKVFAPKNGGDFNLHQLNNGVFLNFFENQKTMKIGITINIDPVSVKIFKSWCGIINTNYPIKKMIIKTNKGQERIITEDHYRYSIKEGRHTVPLKNRNDWEDLRGEWATLEIEIESKNNQKIDVFSFINFVRHSFQ